MPLTFYPHSDDVRKGTIEERLEILMEAAERYKAVVLDVTAKPEVVEVSPEPKRMVPRELVVSYNWEEIAIILREIRESAETSKADKLKKSQALRKLAEVYEVLRAAKMPKLEAVRLALISEATQLASSAVQGG